MSEYVICRFNVSGKSQRTAFVLLKDVFEYKKRDGTLWRSTRYKYKGHFGEAYGCTLGQAALFLQRLKRNHPHIVLVQGTDKF